MCELPTNALNKIFLMLHKEIVRYDGTEDNYLEKFKFALLTKRERARFPDDKEFADAMETRQVYQMTAKNKLYILERFENAGTSEDIQRGKLKEVKVNVPPTELMEQYRNISEPIREQILNVKRQIILLREARDRLLPKLMNGEIEV